MAQSLLIVNTGHGKGKTTAALGQVFRALGHGFNVCVLQFLKGSLGNMVNLKPLNVYSRTLWKYTLLAKDLHGSQKI